ncbi:myosin-2 heavy chain-like [Teratosphaeria destructans]|uniref:Myosin-2 heavy chain-like n=1 Tax=Teratosphaeria destructans TaxID=418781 RepID=A0A9W7SXG3_9PEZI|nr:myosin-2 heavy chain-like [Teratosphaeria destructans]
MLSPELASIAATGRVKWTIPTKNRILRFCAAHRLSEHALDPELVHRLMILLDWPAQITSPEMYSSVASRLVRFICTHVSAKKLPHAISVGPVASKQPVMVRWRRFTKAWFEGRGEEEVGELDTSAPAGDDGGFRDTVARPHLTQQACVARMTMEYATVPTGASPAAAEQDTSPTDDIMDESPPDLRPQPSSPSSPPHPSPPSPTAHCPAISEVSLLATAVREEFLLRDHQSQSYHPVALAVAQTLAERFSVDPHETLRWLLTHEEAPGTVAGLIAMGAQGAGSGDGEARVIVGLLQGLRSVCEGLKVEVRVAREETAMERERGRERGRWEEEEVELRREIGELRSEREELRRKVEEVQGEKEELRSQRDRLGRRVDELQEERDRIKWRVEEMEGERAWLRSKFEEVEGERDRFRSRVDEAMREKNAAASLQKMAQEEASSSGHHAGSPPRGPRTATPTTTAKEISTPAPAPPRKDGLAGSMWATTKPSPTSRPGPYRRESGLSVSTRASLFALATMGGKERGAATTREGAARAGGASVGPVSGGTMEEEEEEEEVFFTFG